MWHLSEWVSLMSMVSIRTSTGLYISRNFNLYGFLVHGWQAIFTFCWSSPWEFTMLKCLILIRNHNLPLPGPYKDLRPRAYYFAEKSKYWTFIVKIFEKFFGEFVPHKTRQLFSEFNFFSFFEAESTWWRAYGVGNCIPVRTQIWYMAVPPYCVTRQPRYVLISVQSAISLAICCRLLSLGSVDSGNMADSD